MSWPLVAGLATALAVGCNTRSDAPPKPPPTVEEQGRAPAEEPAGPTSTEESRRSPTAADRPATPPVASDSAAKPPAPGWIGDLAHSDAAIREQAAAELAQQSDPTALLTQHVDNPAVEVRRGAAFGLLSIFNSRNAEHTAAMHALLSDADETVRRVALQAVSQWSQDDPVAAEVAAGDLEAMVRDSSGDTFERTQAVRILGRLGSLAQPALVHTFRHDSDANVRKAALAAAMRSRPAAETIAGPLTKVLADDANAAMRRQAALHLKSYGSQGGVLDALAAALTDSDSDVRLEAATSLAASGEGALPFVADLLDSSQPQIRLYAVFALGKMGRAAEPALPKLRQLTSDPDANVAKTAAGVIRVIEASPR